MALLPLAERAQHAVLPERALNGIRPDSAHEPLIIPLGDDLEVGVGLGRPERSRRAAGDRPLDKASAAIAGKIPPTRRGP